MPLIPDKTLRELGWPRFLETLASETRTVVGRELAAALPFLDEKGETERHLSRIGEARELTRQALELPLSGVPDVREHLQRASREGVLDSFALRDCAALMRASARVRRFLASRTELAPQLAHEVAELSDFEPLAAEIERAIDPGGTIADHASPLLAELRERSRGLHRAIKGRIDELLHDLDYEEVLRDKYYTIRDDRYVLPVIAQHKARMPGIVHNASQSGQTLFVEPEQLVDLGNHLTIAQSMAAEEEQRILRDFTEAVGRRAEELEEDVARLGELDRVFACARIADRLDATTPKLASATSTFSLPGLRHPLLALRGVKVVPNDLVLGEGRRGLVVSGPNAGGKTVSITAIGLSALMARAGLPVPANEGASIPLYRAVYTAIGDEQDLSKDLSTFSAHLTALRDIAINAIPGTLVCVDEIAAGTDPREGAAIATAVLEDLIERGATVLLTTHLDELKAKGLTDPRLSSASMEFDFTRLAPTYSLRMNTAGSSSAIEIAGRVGLSESVCDRARELLGGSGGALGTAIQSLDRERDEVSRLRRTLDDERLALVRAREGWEQQRRALEEKEKRLEAGLRREVVQEIERARAEVRRLVAQLQEQPTVKAAVEAQKALEKAAEAQKQEVARAEAVARAAATREAADVDRLRPGMRVQVAGVGREGEILELAGDVALVAVGALKTRVPLADLVPLKGAPKQTARMKRSDEEKREAVEKARAGRVEAAPNNIDLRGMRTEDALRELRASLDRLYQNDVRQVFVVHGHGTGALKKAVREELESSSYARTFRPGETHEGGDGVTVVDLNAS